MSPDPYHLLGAMLVSAVLLSLGALAGFFVGQRISFSQPVAVVPQPPAAGQILAIELDRCVSGGHDLAKQSAALAQAARSLATPLPAAIIAAIERLGETTRHLVLRLDQIQTAQASRPATAPALARLAEPVSLSLPGATKSSLTPAEICVFTGQTEALEERGAPRSQRHPYDCVQRLAEWNEGDPLPLPANMIEVRCHDISVEGISFFLPEKPGFELAVISLGQAANGALMAIEVRHSKVVFMHGAVQHLVGCRFVKRVDSGDAGQSIALARA